MKQRKIPLRRCIASGEQHPKAEMLRIVVNPDGIIIADLTGKVNGRGAYFKLSSANIETLKKSRALERALETKVSEEFYFELEKLIKK